MAEDNGIIPRIAEIHEEMTAWRRDIHAHPELGFEEHRTSGIVAEKLKEFGCEVTTGIGQTGVVGSLRIGNSTKAIGLRADMDALPILEANSFDYRSQYDGKMHACGHDGHTAILLGVAKYLAETRKFDGQVHFIFQPAEEGIGGARAMIEDGLFEKFPCDAVFGMHNRPGLAVGEFCVRSGAMMAGGAFFDIDIVGKGAHGARPESGIDSVVIASHMVTALQTIVSRNANPLDTVVMSVTQIHSGDAYNVIPQTARLSGTVRAFSSEAMALVEERMTGIVQGVAAGFGATAEVDFRNIFAPTFNNPAEAEYAAQICDAVVGEDKVDRDPPLIMASEDFSFMLQEVPGCYINVGNGDGDDVCEVHHPAYDFNDEALPYGASFFARLIEDRLQKEEIAS